MSETHKVTLETPSGATSRVDDNLGGALFCVLLGHACVIEGAEDAIFKAIAYVLRAAGIQGMHRDDEEAVALREAGERYEKEKRRKAAAMEAVRKEKWGTL